MGTVSQRKLLLTLLPVPGVVLFTTRDETLSFQAMLDLLAPTM